METFSALLAICAGNSPVPGEFPAQRPVTRSFDVFFDPSLNKRLSKHSRGWWFETLSGPLWRHSNDSPGHTLTETSALRPRQMATRLQTAFSNSFFVWKVMYFDSNFTEICSQGCNYKHARPGSDNGLASIKRQAIVCNQLWSGHYHVYASFGRHRWVNLDLFKLIGTWWCYMASRNLVKIALMTCCWRRQAINGINVDHWLVRSRSIHRTGTFIGQGHVNCSDVIMSATASQITGVSIVYSTVCSGADQRKHQSSASLAFVKGTHRWPVNSPLKGPVMRKMFPFDDISCSRYQSLKRVFRITITEWQLQTSPRGQDLA